MPTLFSRIISWDIPSYKIYEDDLTFAFLDINPMHEGHCLVIPKTEVDHAHNLDEPYRSAVATTCQIISKALHKTYDCKRIASVTLGFDVAHVHIHLIPLNTMNEFDFSLCKEANKEELENAREKILENL